MTQTDENHWGSHFDKERIKKVGVSDQCAVFNTDVLSLIEIRHGLDIAQCMAHCALERRESRGAHQRLDPGCDKRDDERYLKHSLAWHDPSGTPRIDYSEVTITRLAPAGRAYGAAGDAQAGK